MSASVAVRRSTPEERRAKFPPIAAGGPRIRVPKYVLVNPETDAVWTVFGLPQGGDTRAETVFWAERLASKNDLVFVRPPGWESVVGDLP